MTKGSALVMRRQEAGAPGTGAVPTMRRSDKVLETIVGRKADDSRDLAALCAGDPAAAARMVEALRRLAVLAEVADTVTERLSLDHQLPRMIELIADVFDAERATLFLHDPETGELFSRVARGDGVAEIRIPVDGGHRRRGVPLPARPRSSPTPTRTRASIPRSTAGPAIDAQHPVRAPAQPRRRGRAASPRR